MGTKKLYDMGGSGPRKTSGDGDPFYSPKRMAKAGNMGRIDYFAQMGIEMVDDTMEYSMMKKGGAVKKKKKQGYNSRLDESLGMRNKGKKKQSMKSRRNESKGAKKAAGKRAYSGNRSSGRKR